MCLSTDLVVGRMKKGPPSWGQLKKYSWEVGGGSQKRRELEGPRGAKVGRADGKIGSDAGVREPSKLGGGVPPVT